MTTTVIDFESSAGYVIGIARELHGHCAAKRNGVEMPVGKSIKDYVLQCTAPKFAQIKVARVPLGTDDDLPVRAALAVHEVAGQTVARIAYASELNRCWARFVVTKEFMHLLLDRAEDRTSAAVAQLSAIVTPISNPFAKIPSEAQAMLGALEYLLPYDDRPRELPSDANGALAVATRFRIPRTWVEWFYRNELNYKTISDAYHATLPPPAVSK